MSKNNNANLGLWPKQDIWNSIHELFFLLEKAIQRSVVFMNCLVGHF
jgi:hypothetical protein